MQNPRVEVSEKSIIQWTWVKAVSMIRKNEEKKKTTNVLKRDILNYRPSPQRDHKEEVSMLNRLAGRTGERAHEQRHIMAALRLIRKKVKRGGGLPDSRATAYRQFKNKVRRVCSKPGKRAVFDAMEKCKDEKYAHNEIISHLSAENKENGTFILEIFGDQLRRAYITARQSYPKMLSSYKSIIKERRKKQRSEKKKKASVGGRKKKPDQKQGLKKRAPRISKPTKFGIFNSETKGCPGSSTKTAWRNFTRRLDARDPYVVKEYRSYVNIANELRDDVWGSGGADQSPEFKLFRRMCDFIEANKVRDLVLQRNVRPQLLTKRSCRNSKKASRLGRTPSSDVKSPPPSPLRISDEKYVGSPIAASPGSMSSVSSIGAESEHRMGEIVHSRGSTKVCVVRDARHEFKKSAQLKNLWRRKSKAMCGSSTSSLHADEFYENIDELCKLKKSEYESTYVSGKGIPSFYAACEGDTTHAMAEVRLCPSVKHGIKGLFLLEDAENFDAEFKAIFGPRPRSTMDISWTEGKRRKMSLTLTKAISKKVAIIHLICSRTRGFGTYLTKAIISDLQDKGFHYIILQSLPFEYSKNDLATRYFRNLGGYSKRSKMWLEGFYKKQGFHLIQKISIEGKGVFDFSRRGNSQRVSEMHYDTQYKLVGKSLPRMRENMTMMTPVLIQPLKGRRRIDMDHWVPQARPAPGVKKENKKSPSKKANAPGSSKRPSRTGRRPPSRFDDFVM